MNDNQKPKLFCNCDGVLTSARSYYIEPALTEDHFDSVALGMLEKFCKDLDIEVVMASAWPMFKTAKAWREAFASKGFDIPVVERLERDYSKGGDWAEAMQDYMEMMTKEGPQCKFVLLQDDPDEPNQPFLINVDARVGLTVDNLREAAEMLRPESPVISRLEQLSKSFSPDKTITIGVPGGPSVSVHPRDLAKGLDQLGIPPAPHKQ